MSMPRVETPEITDLITARTVNSALWFINNAKLQERMLAYLAKYSAKHGVILYAFVIQGNHYHLIARFPRGNRAAFEQDFNAIIPALVRKYVSSYPGGPFWGAPYVEQALSLAQDIKRRFFYCALQAPASGLAERISDYHSYNSFSDAASGITRWFKVVRWSEYNEKRRYNDKVTIAEFTDRFALTFQRIPGFEDMSKRDYCRMLHNELETRRVEIVNARKAEGKGYPSPEKLQQMEPGSLPRSTKKSTRNSYRPRVISESREAREQFLEFYFGVVRAYREASRRYRNGELNVEFPPGTYKPHLRVPAVAV